MSTVKARDKPEGKDWRQGKAKAKARKGEGERAADILKQARKAVSAARKTAGSASPGASKPGRTQRYASIWEAIQVPSGGEPLIDAIHEGFGYEVIVKLADESGLEKKRVADYVHIPPATLSRRSKQGRFTTDESDRLWRLAKLLEAATDLFEGDEDSASAWINKSAYGLNGRKPIEMIGTSIEFNAVLALIRRLEHGVLP